MNHEQIRPSGPRIAVFRRSEKKEGGTVKLSAIHQPLLSLIAGILILIVPGLLNLIVALYLIVAGLLGMIRGQSRLFF
jgi:UPF0716 family protein affecting phage T7 exclusion